MLRSAQQSLILAAKCGKMTNESGPESAVTDRGLATYSTEPKGA